MKRSSLNKIYLLLLCSLVSCKQDLEVPFDKIGGSWQLIAFSYVDARGNTVNIDAIDQTVSFSNCNKGKGNAVSRCPGQQIINGERYDFEYLISMENQGGFYPLNIAVDFSDYVREELPLSFIGWSNVYETDFLSDKELVLFSPDRITDPGSGKPISQLRFSFAK